ncbi:MAG: Dabb family protein [Breznakibacter sp.]
MVKHIVLFKFKPFENQTAKEKKLGEIKSALLALRDKLDFLREIEVGINANPNENFDLALTTVFDSMDDLIRYAKHPDHVAVASLIGPIREDRACVDYIF